MSEKLSKWLNKQLEKRNWSARELGRRSGLSGAHISRVINEEQKVTFDFCAAIAQALGEPTEDIFRLAGLLPPLSEPGPDEDQLLETYRQLPPFQQQFMIDILRGLRPNSNGSTSLPPEPTAPPRLEDIMNILEQLDQYELQAVYDYTRWRAEEQNRRRKSSGKRQVSEEKRKEQQEVVKLIDLMLTVEEATPRERELFIVYLVKSYVLRWGDCPEELMKILPPSIIQLLPSNLGCSSQSDEE